MATLIDRLLPADLWARIHPLLPPPPRPRGGVARTIPDRNCVAARILMPRTSTCGRRLDQWAQAGVFETLQAVLLDELGEAGRIDLDRVLVDSVSLRAT